MSYIVIAAILTIMILLYFRVADRFNIIDKPNERSSHKGIIIRGGGIIFPLSAIIWFVWHGFQYPLFTAGLVMIAAVSMVDDIYTISVRPRLLVHFTSVLLLLYQLQVFDAPWIWWAVGFVMVIGWINAFNFMDGINGITAFYALSVSASIFYINKGMAFIDEELVIITMLALGVFAFFNARKKAKTFAGDVGSVSMAFIISFMMVRLIQHTGRWEYILLVSVYGVDSVITIAQRLLRKENIFKPHRTHLYQYLANEMKVPHVYVSGIYAAMQLAVNAVFIYAMGSHPELATPLAVALLLLMGAAYLALKIGIQRKIKQRAA